MASSVVASADMFPPPPPTADDYKAACVLTWRMRQAQREFYASPHDDSKRRMWLSTAQRLEREWDRLTRHWGLGDDQAQE